MIIEDGGVNTLQSIDEVHALVTVAFENRHNRSAGESGSLEEAIGTFQSERATCLIGPIQGLRRLVQRSILESSGGANSTVTMGPSDVKTEELTNLVQRRLDSEGVRVLVMDMTRTPGGVHNELAVVTMNRLARRYYGSGLTTRVVLVANETYPHLLFDELRQPFQSCRRYVPAKNLLKDDERVVPVDEVVAGLLSEDGYGLLKGYEATIRWLLQNRHIVRGSVNRVFTHPKTLKVMEFLSELAGLGYVDHVTGGFQRSESSTILEAWKEFDSWQQSKASG
jgi:hypothetical protein